MKKHFVLLLFALTSLTTFGQEPVLTYSGDLFFIPGSMTKDGEAFLVTVNSYSNGSYTIYDGDLKTVKDFKDSAAGQPYQQRIVTMTRIYDPGSESGSGSGTITRSDNGDDGWTVTDDQTTDYVTSSSIAGFEMYSDDNSYHTRYIYVSQTLFDDDEEFEYLRTRQTIIPIETKYKDYIKEHSTGTIDDPQSSSWGDETIDAMMRETGADNFERIWDETSGRYLYRLYKYEYYGGTYNKGMEIVSTDGKVKGAIPDISFITSAYYFRGRCYVQGRGNDNSRVLYLLGNKTSDIKEVKREKVPFSVRSTGNNLIVKSEGTEGHTVVLTNMGGQVLRHVRLAKGNTILPLQGLMGGVYNVTLFERSTPLSTTKVLVK